MTQFTHDGGDDDSNPIIPNPDDKGGATAGVYGSEDPVNMPIPGEGEEGVDNSHQ